MKYYTREENIRYLRRFTNYNTSRYSDGQLASIRKKTEASIEKKIASILAYQESHTILRTPYTLEKLQKKTIEELREIETKYGINSIPEKKTDKQRKEPKVEQIKMSDVIPETIELRNEHITEKSSEETEEMAYLTEEELQMMYPGEDYSVPELKTKGIILNVDSQKFNSHEEERRIKKQKFEMAKSIIEIQQKLNMEFYNLSNVDITEIPLEELIEMYEYVTTFAKGYPKAEEVGRKLGLRSYK